MAAHVLINFPLSFLTCQVGSGRCPVKAAPARTCPASCGGLADTFVGCVLSLFVRHVTGRPSQDCVSSQRTWKHASRQCCWPTRVRHNDTSSDSCGSHPAALFMAWVWGGERVTMDGETQYRAVIRAEPYPPTEKGRGIRLGSWYSNMTAPK